MNPNALVREIVAVFRELEQELLQQDEGQWPEGRVQWTKKVLTILCKLGKRLGYTAWATGVPDEYRDGNEWLYDVMWCNSDISDAYDRLISVPMVAECEWDNLEEIEYDFAKLLLARATVRVMVYSAWNARNSDEPAEVINKKLREHVRTFNGASGDTYLLIAYVGDVSETKWFEFAEIIYQGPGDSPILQTL